MNQHYQQWRQLKVQIGDVFRAPSGMLRVVRSVSKPKTARCPSVTFTIQHCSWTGRSTTSYPVSELLRIGYVYTGKRMPLRSNFDKLMAEDAETKTRNFKCCEVRGIP